MERISATLEREAMSMLAKLDTERGEPVLVSDRAAAANAARVHRQIDELLRSQGLDLVSTAAGRRAVEAVSAALKGDAVPVQAQPELQQIIDGQTKEVASLLGKASDEIRQAINLGVSSGADLSGLMRTVADRIHASMSQAAAAIDAGVMGVGRAAVFADAEATMGPNLVFLYTGPSTGRVRPFCAQYVGKALTVATLDSLDNGQLNPVSTFCGGYNCRHTLAPMTRQEAERKGLVIL